VDPEHNDSPQDKKKVTVRRLLDSRDDEGKCHCPRHWIELGEVEMEAVILFGISREIGKSLEWLLTGER
jgi:hypothetical protein